MAYELKNWQRIVKNESEAKEDERLSYIRGIGLIASTVKSDEYKAYARQKAKEKRIKRRPIVEKNKARIKKARQQGYERGYKAGLKGIKKLERAARVEAKAREMIERAKKMRGE